MERMAWRGRACFVRSVPIAVAADADRDISRRPKCVVVNRITLLTTKDNVGEDKTLQQSLRPSKVLSVDVLLVLQALNQGLDTLLLIFRRAGEAEFHLLERLIVVAGADR